MKKIFLSVLFVLSVAGIYSVYFIAVNSILNLPTAQGQLTNNQLSKNTVYFKTSNTDSSQIEVFKYVGKLEEGQKQVICYQSPVSLKEYGNTFAAAVDKIGKEQAKFLFDYNHPVNKLTLEAVADSTLTRWRTEGKILYLRDDDHRDDFFSHSNFLTKAFTFFYLYPFGQVVCIIVLVFVVRGTSLLLNSLPGQWSKAVITIALLSAIFIFMGYLVANEFSFLLGVLQIMIIAIVYYVHHIIQKKSFDFFNKEIVKFYIVILVPVIISLGLGLIQLFGERENTFMALLSINLMGVGLILFSLLAGIPFALANLINNMIDHNLQKKQALLQLELDKKNNEYKAAEVDSLMSRINPHFLFNGLNSIASLANTDGKKAEAMALQLAEFYKYASNRENKIYATVQQELALLDQYLKVEKMRFGDMIVFQIEVDENTQSLYVPYMLLQPLLENAIKYGYDSATGKTEISLQIKQSSTHLVIQVFDSGRPFDDLLQQGFGIHSINRKLEILYGHDYELQFINGPQKHVFLQIPLKTVL